jgi:hypothetical protein
MEGTIYIKNKQEQEYWIDGTLVDKVTTSAYDFMKFGREAYVHYKSGEVETIPCVVVIEVLGTYTLEAKPLPTNEEEKADPDRWWPDKVDSAPISVIICRIGRMRHDQGYGVRLGKIFQMNDIKTVGDLLRIGRREFRTYRSVGGGSISRIDDALEDLYGIEGW